MTSSEWGRVDDDGTVYVRTADGERSVGQYAAGSPEEALAFFAKRFDALVSEVELLEQRIRAGKLSPEEATERVRAVREQVVEANAVGDLVQLTGRLDALAPLIASQRASRKEERAQRTAAAQADKEKLVGEAERIAAGTDWRHGAHRMRELLDQWKALPRIERAADDALWKRFSGARSAYTKARKAHFAVQDERREGARVVKERLAKEAEGLATSTDWGPTGGRYRELMRQWKDAGPAPKEVDDELWKRFRGAQDTFFGARDAANAALDAEFEANAEVKDALIVEAEALRAQLDDGADLDGVKRSFRDLAVRWDAAGKVPRGRVKELEGRMRKVEQAIRAVEDDQWRRSDPEKSARASDLVAQLEGAVESLERDLARARDGGDDRAAARLEEDLRSRLQFLEAARRASADFS